MKILLALQLYESTILGVPNLLLWEITSYGLIKLQFLTAGSPATHSLSTVLGSKTTPLAINCDPLGEPT